MKRKLFLVLLCFSAIAILLVGSVSASAATTTKTASFTLSKTSQSEKKWTKNVTVSSGSATIVAQHWKGSVLPTYSDTAYSKISSSSGLSSRNVKVAMYNTNMEKL